jgi:UDP-2,4-diacetamido-2,4,6-trideoxy-beta-L-altropyranose hydrolase
MLRVRKALESDLMLFYHWRNDPLVVASSFSEGSVHLEDHQRWYRRQLSSGNCSLYVVEHESDPAGQVRFDITGSEAIINYSLDAAFRGRGLATGSLSQAIVDFREEHSDVTDLLAFVKPDNSASCRVFEKLHFACDGFDGKMQANQYRLQLSEDPLVER